MTKLENSITLSKSELKIILFWSHVGTLYGEGGSKSDKIPKLIVKYMKKLKLNPYDFCYFEQPDKNKIAEDVLKEWRKHRK